MGEPIAPKTRHLPLPESRTPTYTGFSPSPSDVAAWQEQPRRIAQWRDEVPVRSKAMGKAVQPESGSSLSMGKGAGVGSAEWSERDKDQPGEVARGGGTADSYRQARTAGMDTGAAGHRASVRQMGSSTSDTRPPRRPDPLVLCPPGGASSTLLVPVPTTSKSMRVPSPSRHTPQRSVSDHPPRLLPLVRSTRSQREAYIADALAIPDELSRPNSIMPVAKASHLDVPAEVHTAPLPIRKSRSAASRKSALEQQGRDADVRKAKSSSSNRLRLPSPRRQNIVHDPPVPQPYTYRSAATTPINPNVPVLPLPAPPLQRMHHGRARSVSRRASAARIRQSSASHLQIPSTAPPRKTSARSHEHEPAHREPTSLQPTLTRSYSPQRQHLGDRGQVRESGINGLQAHFDPEMDPLPPSVMTSPTLVAGPEEKAQMLHSPLLPERQRTTSHPARIISSSLPNQFSTTPTSPALITPTATGAIEHINISAPDADHHPDVRATHPHISAQSSELSTGQPDHISFEVPSGKRGRLRVSLAWFRDRETGGRRRRRHTDTPQSPDSSVPPPLPPKHDPPPRSPARREDERSDERRDRGRQPPLQGRPSDVVPSQQASPRRYDTSPSQYPAQMGGNPMLQRSNTYMTNLPPYQATVPAYRVQFPHNLPVPMQSPHPVPYGNPTGWAVNSMPQLQVPPPSLVSPTRCGPPGTAPFLDQGRSAYHAPPSPRRPPSIEPPTEGSPPAPLRRLPSARLGMSPGTQAYMAPTGYGGMGAAQNGRMPLVTPVVIGIGRGGAMAQEDMMTQRYGQQQPNMWKRMFGGHRRDSDRERYPERYPEHPTEGRIKRWRMNVGRGQPSGPQEERRTEYAPDQRRAERDRGREGKGYGEGRSMLGRFFGNRSRPRQPYTAVDHPADPAVAGPRITPFLSRRPTRPLPSPIPAPIPEGPYTPAPDTKFGNLTLRGRSRRFKTYQPTHLDRSETQRRQREVGRQRQKEAKREEKRTLRRKQREERDAQRAMAREARIRAATGGALGGGLGRSGVREMGQEKGKLQRKPSGRDAGKSGDTRIEGPGLIGQRTGGGIGEWLAKVQRNRG